MLGMRGDEDHRRRARPAAQRGGQLQCRRALACAMSSSTRSQPRAAAASAAPASASPASPTTSAAGSAQSCSSARRRSRASASSSTISARSVLMTACGIAGVALTAAPRCARGNRPPLAPGSQSRGHVVHQAQALAHVRAARCRGPAPRRVGTRVADQHHRLAAPQPGVRTRMRPPCSRRLDAVSHRVLDQRLQHQRRHARARRPPGRGPSCTCSRSPKRICSIAR